MRIAIRMISVITVVLILTNNNRILQLQQTHKRLESSFTRGSKSRDPGNGFRV